MTEPATWKRAPGNNWVVRGVHRELAAALEADKAVTVRLRNGDHVEVYLEHVGRPFADGNAIAHPKGYSAGHWTRSQVEPEAVPEPRSTMRLQGRTQRRTRRRTLRG